MICTQKSDFFSLFVQAMPDMGKIFRGPRIGGPWVFIKARTQARETPTQSQT
jgi:hypothetical protein